MVAFSAQPSSPPRGWQEHGVEPVGAEVLKGGDQTLDIKPFDDIPARSLSITDRYVAGIVRCREHHDRNLPERIVALDLSQDLASVESGKVEVKEYERRRQRVLFRV